MNLMMLLEPSSSVGQGSMMLHSMYLGTPVLRHPLKMKSTSLRKCQLHTWKTSARLDFRWIPRLFAERLLEVPTISDKDSNKKKFDEDFELELAFARHHVTFDVKTPRGDLSSEASYSVEQFSRLNGLSGKKMKANFDSQAPDAIQNEARNLVEYCCFRYLVRGGAEFHPCIKDAAFRRLIFITMLAWQQPYLKEEDNSDGKDIPSHVGQSYNKHIVGEEAFVRIAPAVVGAADRPTSYHLFEVLTGDSHGLSFTVWDTYLSELCRVHEKRVQYRREVSTILGLAVGERVLSVGANSRQPVQKWNKYNIAWPGRLTLTDRALYFEANGMMEHQKSIRLDLGSKASVQRTKVGPFGVPMFDTAIMVKPTPDSEPWVLEFVDFQGPGRRDIWYAFINELVSIYAFIDEYGPAEDDLQYVYGSRYGNRKAVASAIHGIARVQAVQSTLGRAVDHPGRLLQFSYMKKMTSGEVVLQSLAVLFWAGRIEATSKELIKDVLSGNENVTENAAGAGEHVSGADGSVYLKKWMTSHTWESEKSLAFWKQKSIGKGIVVGKDLVVGGHSHFERAAMVCRDQSQMIEKTKATIDAAMLQGIPSNIDLFKELMVPFTLLFLNFKKLRRWENPAWTTGFLAGILGIIYMDWLRYLFPAILIAGACLILLLRRLKIQGQLTDGFGQVTIREQPPSSTLQKIMSLKKALSEVEIQVQKLNITLLKLRTFVLSGHPQATNEVIFALIVSALMFIFVPFRYICAFFIIDQFTCELKFRREMVLKFINRLRERWETIPAAPVVVLPHEKNEDPRPPEAGETSSKTDLMSDLLNEWLGVDMKGSERTT